MRHARTAALATSANGRDRWPFVSLVSVACKADATPILLLSRLAEHTRNLKADPRACLLFTKTGRHFDPQAAARVSVAGRIRQVEESSVRDRFLAWHPTAESYAHFADFAFYEMVVDRAHYVGGFGRIVEIRAQDLLLSPELSAMTSETSAEVIDQINDRDPPIADRLAGCVGRRSHGWRVVLVDPEGCVLRRRHVVIRIEFQRPATSMSALLEIFDEMKVEPNTINS